MRALLSICLLTGIAGLSGRADESAGKGGRKLHFRTELLGKKYWLDDNNDLGRYIRALDSEIERSKKEAPLGEAHQKDPLHNKEPRDYIEKSLRKSMEEARKVARDIVSADDNSRERSLSDLYIMSGAIRASFMHVLPPDMDVFTAIRRENALRHPKVGLGNKGPAANLAANRRDPSEADPIQPSAFWTRPEEIAKKDLFYGFEREELPRLGGVKCVYSRSKQSKGVHGGFDVKCEEYGKVKLKFGEEFSQPVAHRIFWALGFNTPPVDCVPIVKVKWDRRIFTEFNTRKDESMTVQFLGIPIHHERMQPYLDPLAPVREVEMLDERGNKMTVKPNPNWDEFKRKLYKDPGGRPETKANNFNESFANQIQYLVYKNVNLRQKDDEDRDDDAIYLGNWDWNGEGNSSLRENRGFAFVSAWLNQFDSWVHNNKIYMSNKGGKRTFKRYVSDLGGCLGPAVDSAKMVPESPNEFPWSFTLPAKPGTSAIPLDGSFHNIRDNESLKAADINDAKWIARYMAQITGRQILEALVASGMPSAEVRLFYNKLVHRRNKAFADLGLNYPPIKQMDENEDFDYDPQKSGLVTIVTSRKETVSAPDDGWLIVKGRLCSRVDGASHGDSNKKTRKKQS